MQAAYWVGRHSQDRLGGVAAHLYAEFDGRDLDPDRLRDALGALGQRHPMLRLRVDAEGRQHLDRDAPPLPLAVDDLRGLSEADVRGRLAETRRAWTHRRPDLARGEASAFGLTLRPGGACRLHVDTDMIAVDPNGFRIVMDDLARLYAEPDEAGEPAPPLYGDWLDRVSADPDLAQRRARDRAWWRGRLAGIAPAPPLPEAPDPPAGPCSDRLATWLDPAERRALETRARANRITPSSLLLGLFAATLGRAMGAGRFRLNVPAFWREPVIPDVGRIVGEFSNVLILSVDLAAADTLAALCRQVADRMVDLVAHSAHPGVHVMRDLSRHHGGMQTAPVVFTAGIGLAGGDLFGESVERVLGRMVWVISQGPQVALDAQVAAFAGGILVNFDVRLDALPEAWIRDTFESYVALLRAVAADPANLDRPPGRPVTDDTARATEAMLIALQRRLAPGEPAGGDRPIAPAAHAGLAGFLATYLPACTLPPDALAPATTPRRLARRLHALTDGASDDIARIFLETLNET